MKKLRLFDGLMDSVIGFGRGWLVGWTFFGLVNTVKGNWLDVLFGSIVMVCGIGLFGEVWGMLDHERRKAVRKIYGHY